ncbi:hypothetical protein BJV78DRAFT_1286816 [Lactifluus subvellereus]|nr:hypothetical protein BJV78DRAFT_1286816 [Lactifluus subvellereus]
MSFVSNLHPPQSVPGHPFGLYKDVNPSSLLPYPVAAPVPYPAQPPLGAPQQFLPRDVLEQRARTPCKHFEHNQGWCPYGVDCHFLHDHSRLSSRPGSTTSSPPSLASSTASSLRSSPVPSTMYYPSGVNQSAGACDAPLYRVPRHGFTPRTIGGTTYFPIRLDGARLGYVTPVGVQLSARGVDNTLTVPVYSYPGHAYKVKVPYVLN